MDKNLDSRHKFPWWIVLLQISPLVLQIASEVVSRIQGIPILTEGNPSSYGNTNSDPDPALKLDSIPDPIHVDNSSG